MNKRAPVVVVMLVFAFPALYVYSSKYTMSFINIFFHNVQPLVTLIIF